MENKNFQNQNEIFSTTEDQVPIIETLLGSSKEQEYITQRLEKLISKSVKRGINIMTNTHQQGFIHPESEIRKAIFYSPFLVNDNDIYSELFANIKIYSDHKNYKDQPLKKFILRAVQWTIGSYFGNHGTYDTTNNKNRKFYENRSNWDSPSKIDLKEFKNQGIAVCIEKASTAQNLITFLGKESELIIADCEIDPGETGGHAYNIITTSKGKFIYDPTNPFETYHEEKHVKSYNPALYPISETQYTELIEQNKSLHVEHTNEVIRKEGVETINSPRIYGPPLTTLNKLL